METVTVIVPVFNAGSYLEPCLDSILGQTYRQLEIILVNDGSTDGSARICEDYRAKDPRVRVIHKRLGGSGVGAARNTALPLVTGDYILFVDNDDWLEATHVETLYRALKEQDADISLCNFTEYVDDRGAFRFHLQGEDYFQKTLTPAEWFDYQYDARQGFSQVFTVPWAKLYKASLFQGIVYPEDEKVEDDYTTWKLYLLADKLVYSHTGSYFHRKRSNSVTRTVDAVHVFPLRSIQERVTLLSLIGFDVTAELRAYRWRLQLHRESLLEAGQMQDYQKCLTLLKILDKWS
ncbi:glycosyltransferase family 2 protein [Streptococcus danieliae]|nr:glycosyltransferase family 2 protein [Streptococcus danieliae]